MAWAYHVYLVNPEIPFSPIRHTFYGYTKEECKVRFQEHQEVCTNFGPAIAQERFSDEWEEIEEDDLPWIDDDEEDDE